MPIPIDSIGQKFFFSGKTCDEMQTFSDIANVLKRTRARDIPQINPVHENILYV